jgi:putative membrane protein
MKINHLVRNLVVPTLAVCTLLALGNFTTARAADEGNRGQLSHGDYKFATEATHANMAEIELGQLASQKATDQGVRQFAQRMVNDHTKANQQLQQILSQNGVTVPTETSSSQQREMERLQKLNGADFDKAYIDHMVKDHKTDVKEFEKASRDAQNQDLKAFAANTLPTLQDHLRMAEDLRPTVKAEKRAE